MSKLQFSKGKFGRFLSSKGFYVAIGVCLIGAGVATWVAVDRTITGIEDANRQVLQQEQSAITSAAEPGKNTVNEPTKPVEAPKTDIPKPSASSSSSQTPSSSSVESSVPVEQSKPQEQLQVSQTPAYTLPVKGNVINRFSAGELVKNKTLNDWRTHDGVDIAVDKGTDVLAAADGTVAQIKRDDIWGTVITISHADGIQSVYCGLSEIVPVKEGEKVGAKQTIGKVEGVPCEASEPSHIHFAMKLEGIWIDPLDMLTQ